MPANPHRGEVAVTLRIPETDEEREFVLRPSFAAAVEIEQRTGRGIVAIAREVFGDGARMTDLTALVMAGLRAAGEPATPAAVGEMVFATGVLGVLAPARQFLSALLTGGRPPGEADAERATDTRSATSPAPPPQ